MDLFYRPEHALVGDVIPFYDNGIFKPFYLRNSRKYFGPDNYSGWTMITTEDHLHFTEQPTGIHGGTGSVILVDDVYHLFYCTFKQNPKRETVCHAISTDGMQSWETLENENFTPDDVIYEMTDWRDPFVFQNNETGEWWMLLAAKEKGKTRRTGCTGLCVSKDLHHWEYRKPFYAPHLHMSAHECPDLFKMGEWYYLIYSQYTDRFQTYYRMSRSLNGPWIIPAVDSFDTRCFYAAKTGTDGKDRYIYGWNPYRHENIWKYNAIDRFGHDYNSFDWGGVLIVHKLIQNPDGTLGVRPVDSVDQALAVPNRFVPQPLNGNWETGENFAHISSPYGYGTLLFKNQVPEVCKLEADISFSPNVREVGIALQISERFDVGYYLSLQPGRNRIEFKSGLRMYEDGGWTFPFDVEMERPAELSSNMKHRIRIFVQNSVLVCYLDDCVALNARMFDHSRGHFGLFTSYGKASFENIHLWT